MLKANHVDVVVRAPSEFAHLVNLLSLFHLGASRHDSVISGPVQFRSSGNFSGQFRLMTIPEVFPRAHKVI